MQKDISLAQGIYLVYFSCPAKSRKDSRALEGSLIGHFCVSPGLGLPGSLAGGHRRRRRLGLRPRAPERIDTDDDEVEIDTVHLRREQRRDSAT